MDYISSSSVQVGAWVEVDARSSITYRVYPATDDVESTLGGNDGLAMLTNEAGLRHCVTTLARALDVFNATAASPDATHADLVPSADPPADRAG